MADAMGQGRRKVQHHRAALGVTDHGQGSLGDGVQDRDGVAYIGGPGVQRGMLGVAVPPLVPRHDPPASIRQQRSDDIERAGEVEPAVHQGERRCSGVAPLGHGEPYAVGVDGADPIGGFGPGVGPNVGDGIAPWLLRRLVVGDIVHRATLTQRSSSEQLHNATM
jgi:hypothetical protein